MTKRVLLRTGLLWLCLCACPALAGDSPDVEAEVPAEVDPEATVGSQDDEGDSAPLAPPPDPLDPTLPVSEVLWQLGEEKPSHWVEPTEQRVRQGREIVLEGRTTDDSGKPNRVQSPAYLCTDCHHVVREDPDLTVSDPEARLAYAVENDLTFLPGTTLWGTVNRESWFNEDYSKKYGSLVEPANRSLRESVYLCAAECSQGRLMEDWELDAILAYLWTIQITLGDLALSQEDLDFLAAAVHDPAQHEEARARLKAGYLLYSPAHLRSTPGDLAAGYGNSGDAERGREIYQRSCLSCHQAEKGDRRGVRGTYALSDRKGAIAELWRNRTQGNNLSFYQTITHGTRPYGVPMAYMPFFTQERLSDQQADDLRAYFADRLGKEGEAK